MSDEKQAQCGQFFGVDPERKVAFFVDGSGCNAGGEHDFSGWEEGPGYGSAKCVKCGKLAMDHDLMFGP